MTDDTIFQVRVITTRSSAKFRRASCPPPDLCCPLPLKLAGMLNSSPLTSSSSPKSKLHVVNDFSAKYIGNILAQQMNVPKWASVIVAKNGFMNFYLRDDAIREEVQRAGSTMHVDNSKLEMATPHEVSCVCTVDFCYMISDFVILRGSALVYHLFVYFCWLKRALSVITGQERI